MHSKNIRVACETALEDVENIHHRTLEVMVPIEYLSKNGSFDKTIVYETALMNLKCFIEQLTDIEENLKKSIMEEVI